MKRLTLIAISILVLSNAFAQQRKPKTTYEIIEENKKFKVMQPLSSGDKYDGLTKAIDYKRMIPPHACEVTIEKTVHIVFPAPIVYVDLGNENIMAATAGDAHNVLRIKAAVEDFETETNLSVITENGNYYTFNVKYAKEPEKLAFEMNDFLHDGATVNRPNNSMEIYLKELNQESPQLVRMVLKSIYKNNMRLIKHIGSKNFGVQFLLKGIYSYNGMLYFHTEIRNTSNVDYEIDYLNFTITDKKLAKRITIQETQLSPVRAQNHVTTVKGKATECTVFAIPIFTIPDQKVLSVKMHEKNGGRHQQYVIENADLVRAKKISDFIIQ